MIAIIPLVLTWDAGATAPELETFVLKWLAGSMVGFKTPVVSKKTPRQASSAFLLLSVSSATQSLSSSLIGWHCGC